MSYVANLETTLRKLILAAKFVEEHDVLISAEMMDYYKKLCRLARSMLTEYETIFLEKHSYKVKKGEDVYEL